MAVIKANSNDVDLLARLIRAEAEGEGEQGMLMVGNVGVNRILGNCLDFRNIRNMNDMVFRVRVVLKPHRKAILSTGRDRDRQLAQRVINGERIWPASNALWFFRPAGTARQPGTISRTQADSKHTVSLPRHMPIARPF